MGFGWSAKNLTPIGVDFGADSVKLIQLTTDDATRIHAAAALDIPQEARRDAESYRTFVSESLRSVVRKAGFKGKRAVTSISAGQSFIQHVRLPKGDLTLLEDQIQGELRGRLPVDPASLVIRHVNVGEVFCEGSAKQEVICMAASRDQVLRYVQSCKAAGLDIVGMHCEPLAILAAFGHLFRRPEDQQRAVFFLDIGGSTTTALISHGQKLVFAKTIHVGGEHFARQIAEAEGIDLAEARMRRMEQLTAEPVAAAAAASGPAPGQASSPADEAGFGEEAARHCDMLDVLIDELQLCVGYHAAMFQDWAIEKIVFLGGESRQKSMCQRIAQALRIPAQVGDPLARLVKSEPVPHGVDVDLKTAQPGWAVPVGVCEMPTNL